MESFEVSLFEVGFSKIADTLAEYGVDIRWEEKEREKAIIAWEKWCQLDNAQYEEIAHKLLSDIEPPLRQSMKETLNTAIPREVKEVEVTIETNLGESRRYVFASIEEAIKFLVDFDDQEVRVCQVFCVSGFHHWGNLPANSMAKQLRAGFQL